MIKNESAKTFTITNIDISDDLSKNAKVFILINKDFNIRDIENILIFLPKNSEIWINDNIYWIVYSTNNYKIATKLLVFKIHNFSIDSKVADISTLRFLKYEENQLNEQCNHDNSVDIQDIHQEKSKKSLQDKLNSRLNNSNSEWSDILRSKLNEKENNLDCEVEKKLQDEDFKWSDLFEGNHWNNECSTEEFNEENFMKDIQDMIGGFLSKEEGVSKHINTTVQKAKDVVQSERVQKAKEEVTKEAKALQESIKSLLNK